MINPARAALLAVILVVAGTGCQASRSGAGSPDERFGHRVEGRDDEGRETLVIVPPDSELTYRTMPAVFESVTVRPSARDAERGDVAVELLIKGAFPDACTELHDVRQERTGNLVAVSLEMRRPEGAMCATVLRPYRFYLALDGRFAPGSYSLVLNGESHPFEIAEPGG